MPERTLAELMADSARELQEYSSADLLLAQAVDVSVRDIDTCDAAAISIVHRRAKVDTEAASTPEARRSDELQYELGEGPCLDAIWERRTVHSPDLRADDRWPSWGPRMAAEVGFRSLLALQLFTQEDNLGALNLYSRAVDAFDHADIEYAEALAAHLAVALHSAQHIDQLDEALAARSVIGMAVGIIMERYALDSDRAFAVLTRVSSTTNRKVRYIAADLVAGKPFAQG